MHIKFEFYVFQKCFSNKIYCILRNNSDNSRSYTVFGIIFNIYNAINMKFKKIYSLCTEFQKYERCRFINRFRAFTYSKEYFLLLNPNKRILFDVVNKDYLFLHKNCLMLLKKILLLTDRKLKNMYSKKLPFLFKISISLSYLNEYQSVTTNRLKLLLQIS